MGYSIYYQGTSQKSITAEERSIISKNVAKWNDKLSESSEDYAWTYSDDGCQITGFTKPGMDDEDMDEDLEVLVSAVRELQQSLPSIEFTVTDDFDFEHFP